MMGFVINETGDKRTLAEIVKETNVEIASEEYLIAQVSNYIRIATKIHAAENLGSLYKAEAVMAIAAMVQQENIFGDEEAA
jgi:hypothetical protein